MPCADRLLLWLMGKQGGEKYIVYQPWTASLLGTVVRWPWLEDRCPPKLLHHSLSWTGESKYNERLKGRDKGRERSFTSYRHGQNRLNLGKLV